MSYVTKIKLNDRKLRVVGFDREPWLALSAMEIDTMSDAEIILAVRTYSRLAGEIRALGWARESQWDPYMLNKESVDLIADSELATDLERATARHYSRLYACGLSGSEIKMMIANSRKGTENLHA